MQNLEISGNSLNFLHDSPTPSPPAKMKALSILAENSLKLEIKLLPCHPTRKPELVSDTPWSIAANRPPPLIQHPGKSLPSISYFLKVRFFFLQGYECATILIAPTVDPHRRFPPRHNARAPRATHLSMTPPFFFFFFVVSF